MESLITEWQWFSLQEWGFPAKNFERCHFVISFLLMGKVLVQRRNPSMGSPKRRIGMKSERKISFLVRAFRCPNFYILKVSEKIREEKFSKLSTAEIYGILVYIRNWLIISFFCLLSFSSSPRKRFPTKEIIPNRETVRPRFSISEEHADATHMP